MIKLHVRHCSPNAGAGFLLTVLLTLEEHLARLEALCEQKARVGPWQFVSIAPTQSHIATHQSEKVLSEAGNKDSTGEWVLASISMSK